MFFFFVFGRGRNRKKIASKLCSSSISPSPTTATVCDRTTHFWERASGAPPPNAVEIPSLALSGLQLELHCRGSRGTCTCALLLLLF